MKKNEIFFAEHSSFAEFLRDPEVSSLRGAVFKESQNAILTALAQKGPMTTAQLLGDKEVRKKLTKPGSLRSTVYELNITLNDFCQQELNLTPPMQITSKLPHRPYRYHFERGYPSDKNLKQQLNKVLTQLKMKIAEEPEVPAIARSAALLRLKPFFIENFLRKDERNPNPDPTQLAGFEWSHFESKCFVESEISKEALRNLNKYKHLRIEGGAGSGKTTIARYVGYILKNDRGKMVICTEPWREIDFPDIGDLSELGEYYMIMDDIHIPEAMRFVEKVLEVNRARLIVMSRGIDLGSATHRFPRLQQFLEETPVVNVKAEDIAYLIVSNVAAQLRMSRTEVQENLDDSGLNWREDLVSLSFGLRTLKKEGELTKAKVMEFVRNRIGKDLETEFGLNKKETEKVFIALAAFYQFEIPVLRAFFIECLGVDEDLIKHLVNFRQIVSYYSEFGEMLRLHHSSWARLCMECFRHFDDFPTSFGLRFGTPSREWIVDIYKQYLNRFPKIGLWNLPDLLDFCYSSGPRSHYDCLRNIPVPAWESQDLVLTTLNILNPQDMAKELRKLDPDSQFDYTVDIVDDLRRLCTWPTLLTPKELLVITRSLKEIIKSILGKDWRYAAMKGARVETILEFPPRKVRIDQLLQATDIRYFLRAIFRYNRDYVASTLDKEYEALKNIFVGGYETECISIHHSTFGLIAYANKAVAKKLLAEVEIFTDTDPHTLGNLLKLTAIIDAPLARHFLQQSIKVGLLGPQALQDKFGTNEELLQGLCLVDETLAFDLCDTLDVQSLGLWSSNDLIFSLAPYSYDVARKIVSMCVEKGPLSVDNVRQFFSPESEGVPLSSLSYSLALLTHFLPKRTAELLHHLPLQWLKDRLEPIRLAQLTKCIAQYSPLVKRTLAKMSMQEFLDYDEVIWIDVKKALQYVTTWYCVNKRGWRDVVHRSGCDYVQEIPHRVLIKYTDRRKVFEDGKVSCEHCHSDIFAAQSLDDWYLSSSIQ